MVTQLDTMYLGTQGIDAKYIPTKIQQREVKALIDSGTLSNFMSKETTECLGVKQRLIVPITASRADRKQFRTKVLETTEPVCIRIGGHAEWISFYILETSLVQVILGRSWLELYQPEVDWKTFQPRFT